MYTIVLVNVKRFRARCGFYGIENKLLLLLLLYQVHRLAYKWATAVFNISNSSTTLQNFAHSIWPSMLKLEITRLVGDN